MIPGWKQTLKTGETKAVPELLRLGVGVTNAKAVDGREEAIEFVMNGSTADRGGDIVHHSGARLDAFLANPVMPWGHDYRSLPLGGWENVRVEAENLRGLGVFSAREVYPFAETVLQMYLRRILRACSIGFRSLKWAWNEERGPWAIDYLEYELLECSAVMIGQHQDALATLSLARAEGLNVGPLLEEFERVVAAEGRGLFVPVDQAKRVLLALGPRFFDLAPSTKVRAEVLELEAGGAQPTPTEEASDPPQIERIVPDAVVPVVGCAGCGGAHKAVEFVELSKATGSSTHWGVCPETGDPIFLSVATRGHGHGEAPGAPAPEDDLEMELLRALCAGIEEATERGVRDGEMALTGAMDFDD